jgi:hypothetical protein
MIHAIMNATSLNNFLEPIIKTQIIFEFKVQAND